MKVLATALVLGSLLASCSESKAGETSQKHVQEEGGDTSYVFEGIYDDQPTSTSITELNDGQRSIRIESSLFSENDSGIVIKTSTITNEMKLPNTQYRKFHNRRIEITLHRSAGNVQSVILNSTQMTNEKGFALNRRIKSIEIKELKNDSIFVQMTTDDLSSPIGSNDIKHAFAIPINNEIDKILVTEI